MQRNTKNPASQRIIFPTLFLLFTLFSLLTLFLPVSVHAAATLTCKYDTSLPTGVEYSVIFKAKNDTGGYNNAHAQLENYSTTEYPNNFYCQVENTHTIDNDCSNASAQAILGLSAETNSHVQVPGLGYNESACMAITPGGFTCEYVNTTCSAGYSPLFSMSSGGANNQTNAHIANYSHYTLNVCCKINNGPPTMSSLLLEASDDPNNYTTATLTATGQDVVDPDGDTVRMLYDWRLEGESIAVLNMNFDLDDSAGAGKTKDYSTHSNNGTLGTGANEPTFNSTGGFNSTGAYQFDGSDDFINLSTSIPALEGTNISVEAWVKGTYSEGGDWTCTNGYCAILTQYNGTDDGYYLYVDDSVRTALPAFWGASGVEAKSSTSLSSGVWYHLVGTANDTHLAIYVNGVLKDTEPWVGKTGASHTAYIGYDEFWGVFNGTIDDVRVYNRSLTQAEITSLYNNQTNKMVSDETTRGQNWSVCATPNDGTVEGSEYCSNTLQILNQPPNATSVTISSESGNTRPDDNLTATVTGATDGDDDTIYYAYDWRIENQSIAVVNMNFDVNNSAGTGKTKDYSTNSNNGTVNATWCQTCGWNNTGAYQFDGTNNYSITIADNGVGELDLNTSTITAWVKRGTISDASVRVIDKASNYLMSIDNSNKVVVVFYGLQDISITSNTAIGTGWHHLAGVYNGTHIAIYINGSLDNAEASNGTVTTSNTDVLIGNVLGNNRRFNGTIDDVRIYNRSLTQAEITALYNNQSNHIVSNETVIGENWSVCVTPNDLRDDGAEYCSAEYIINNTKPSVPTLQYPTENNESVEERYVTFDWSDSTDGENDDITYDFNLTHATCSDDSQTSLASSGYTSGELCVDSSYNWSVRACDKYECSAWTSTWNFTIASSLGINFTTNNTYFGEMTRGASNDTTNDDPAPLVVENTGNVKVNLTLRGNTPLFTTSGLDNDSFQYKARENESNAYESANESWLNVSASFTDLARNLGYNGSADAMYVDLGVDLPADEPPGLKESTIEVNATYNE